MKSVYIIAELSANHNNNLELAKNTITAMKESGANAVKFQTYTADSLTLDVDNEYFQPKTDGLWKGYTLHQLYSEAAMPYQWYPELIAHTKSIGLEWFSSPFDSKGVQFLESLDCPKYKIASFEIQDIPLIRSIAQTGKPIILSTGIAKLSDIELALETIYKEGNKNVSLLKCTSAYPAPFEEINLKTIPHMKETFNCPVGVSDHTLGAEVALGAVALGAEIVEKHVVMNRKQGGVDSSFSMEPTEFKQMVNSIRNLEKALGRINYDLTEKTIESRKRGRSLFIVADVKKGEMFTEENVRSIRPGGGLHPKYLNDIIGKSAIRNIKKGTPTSTSIY